MRLIEVIIFFVILALVGIVLTIITIRLSIKASKTKDISIENNKNSLFFLVSIFGIFPWIIYINKVAKNAKEEFFEKTHKELKQ